MIRTANFLDSRYRENDAIGLSTRLARRAWLLAVVVTSAFLLTSCSNDKSAVKFNATDVTGAAFGQTLALNDSATLEPRTLDSFKGKATVFFFGYMFCPDYCPTTMTTLNEVLGKMKPEDAAKVQVVFVTVDPARDKPKILTDYVKAFNPNFAALYGSDEQTATVAKEFKIIYQKSQVKSEFTYMVDHSTQMYAFDPQGRIRLMIRHEAGPEAIAKDLTALLNG